jgi:leader peptidase (prepilin peptidase)/N-methyltransferase
MTAALITAVVTVTGLVVALAVRPVLHSLPEPVAAQGKTPYRDLATPCFVVACVGFAMLAQGLALVLLHLRVQPLWTVLAVCGVLLAAIDARTTWLPLRLTRVGWALMAVAVGTSLPLGASVAAVVRTAAGSVAAGTLYLVIWAVTRGGFGFGDVRFAPLLGAATASQSWTLLIWGLTAGTAVGAVHGGLRLLGRRKGSFPYAPSMLAGCYLAALLLYFPLSERGP